LIISGIQDEARRIAADEHGRSEAGLPANSRSKCFTYGRSDDDHYWCNRQQPRSRAGLFGAGFPARVGNNCQAPCISKWQRGQPLRLMVGEYNLLGAVVMGDQKISRTITRDDQYPVDITPIRQQLLESNAQLGQFLNDYWLRTKG